MPPKRKNVWRDFTECPEDYSNVSCNHCGKIISRGKSGTLKARLTNAGMLSHLASYHKEAETERVRRDVAAETVQQEEQDARRGRDESAMAATTIYGLRNKKLRSDFLDMVSLCCIEDL